MLAELARRWNAQSPTPPTQNACQSIAPRIESVIMTRTKTTSRTIKYVRWNSHSIWVAWLIFLFYVVFTFVLPVIPFAFIVGKVGGPLVMATPFIALAIWLAAMTYRIRVRKNRKQLIWTAFRYGIITLGGTGIIMMLLSMSTPWHVRKNEQLAAQMREMANRCDRDGWNAQRTKKWLQVFGTDTIYRYLSRDRTVAIVIDTASCVLASTSARSIGLERQMICGCVQPTRWLPTKPNIEERLNVSIHAPV